MSQAPAVFVTGTDTEAGKSIASAWLVRQLQADYWKPIQSGLEEQTDSQKVAHLAGLSPGQVLPERFRLQRPMSPHISAELEGVSIGLDDFQLPQTTAPLVVEGAGGVLVPLNGRDLMIDLMVQLDLPVIVTARTGLGTINHTLLTLEALRSRGLTVLGLILSGAAYPSNHDAVVHYGQAPLIAHIPLLDPLTPEALAQVAPLNAEPLKALR
uniref:ATP-dependent dethiobiotin synthetase BioD n=1 Tax=Magnetococcus massalia (strain MO-1) TaxID=451514 RepID=A0A1S7LPD0_MAGMO|nr:Dethiobiotin synthetase [Candidatus Magnetococcus massalia]